jgi:hypothetical protein
MKSYECMSTVCHQITIKIIESYIVVIQKLKIDHKRNVHIKGIH